MGREQVLGRRTEERDAFDRVQGVVDPLVQLVPDPLRADGCEDDRQQVVDLAGATTR